MYNIDGEKFNFRLGRAPSVSSYASRQLFECEQRFRSKRAARSPFMSSYYYYYGCLAQKRALTTMVRPAVVETQNDTNRRVTMLLCFVKTGEYLTGRREYVRECRRKISYLTTSPPPYCEVKFRDVRLLYTRELTGGAGVDVNRRKCPYGGYTTWVWTFRR